MNIDKHNTEVEGEFNCSDMKKIVEAYVEMWNKSWIGYIFFGFFVFFPFCIILFNLGSGGFERNDQLLGFIVCILFVLIGIGGIIYIVYMKKRTNQLYKHFIDGTIIVKKAEIIKFKYFRYQSKDGGFREGYYIIASIGNKTYKSEAIDLWCFFLEKRNIDKNYYIKKGIPFGPKDPNYHGYEEQASLKAKELENRINELHEQLNDASRFKRYRISNNISKLEKERIGLFPYALPYRGKKYYIGDEIEVYIDPENSRNYIM